MITQNDNIVKKKTTANEIVGAFAEHKKFAQSIQLQIASFLSGAKRDRVLSCGDYLELSKYKDPLNTTKLSSANFCKNRLCPMCAWRDHLKLFEPLTQAVNTLNDKELYHIVLTIPNQKYLTKDFFTSFKEKAVAFLRKDIGINDYIMSLEITVSEIGDYHPHFHILAIASDLENRARRDLQYKWAQRLKVNRSWVILYVEKADNTTLNELTKYIVKFESKSTPTEKLQGIYLATKGIRRYSLAGAFKTAYKTAQLILKIQKTDEKTELLKYGQPEIEFYKWLGTGYTKYTQEKAPSTLTSGDDITIFENDCISFD